MTLNIFYLFNGLLWYMTSNTQIMHEFSVNTLDFQNYAKANERFNQNRKNVYISVIKHSPDDFLFIEHNKPLNKKEINKLLDLEKEQFDHIEKC